MGEADEVERCAVRRVFRRGADGAVAGRRELVGIVERHAVGPVAVPGGQSVFDLFLQIGFDAFHLSRAHGVMLPGGRAVFSACDAGLSAEAVLARAGFARKRKDTPRSGAWRRNDCLARARAEKGLAFASAIAFDPGLVSVRGPDWPDP